MRKSPPKSGRSRTARQHGLDVLDTLRQSLAETRARQQQEQAAQARQTREAGEDAKLFRATVGPVQPIKHSAAAQHTLPGKIVPNTDKSDHAEYSVPSHRAQHADKAARNLLSISDDYEPPDDAALDESSFYIRPGVNAQIVRKLRRGVWKTQAYLDLHGMRLAEARFALSDFLEEALAQRLCCVRIIHGKGFGSPHGKSVLKAKVRTWLAQYDAVLAFCQAAPHEGGTGAVVVLLKSQEEKHAL